MNAPCSDEWRTLPNTLLEGGRSEFASVCVNDEAYLIGGLGRGLAMSDTVTSYNCTTGKCTRHPSLPGEGRCKCVAAAVLHQNAFVVVGGASLANDDRSTFLYSITTKSWTHLPDLKKRREKPCCICVDKKIYTIGGYNRQDGICEKTVEVLDLSMPKRGWTVLPTRMQQGREGCAAVVDSHGDKIIVTGGYNNNDGYLNSIEVLDTHQGWKPILSLPPMMTARSDHQVVSLQGGRILVVLGGTTNSEFATKTVELLRLENNGRAPQWIRIPSLETWRTSFAAFATTTTTTTTNTRPGILVIGGWDLGWNTLDSMEFLEEPSEQDMVYWTLLNPPQLTHPTNHPPCHDECLVHSMEQQRDEYQTQVLAAIQEIWDVMDNNNNKEVGTSSGRRRRRLATPLDERIGHLRGVLDKFLSAVDEELDHIRRCSHETDWKEAGIPASVSPASSQCPSEQRHRGATPNTRTTRRNRKAQIPSGAAQAWESDQEHMWHQTIADMRARMNPLIQRYGRRHWQQGELPQKRAARSAHPGQKKRRQGDAVAHHHTHFHHHHV